MVGALIGAGANVFSSWLQARAASKAAEAQQRAAQQVADQTGQVAGESAGYIAGAGNIVGQEILDETRAGQGRVDEGVIRANDILSGVQSGAQTALNPYMQAGTTGLNAITGMLEGPGFTFNQDDPSYQFRLNESLKALERSGAARGRVAGGGAESAIVRRASDFASTEFDKAFARFQQERQQRLQAAGVLTGVGANATSDMVRTGTIVGTQQAGNVTRGSEFNATIGQQGVRDSGGIRYGAAVDAGRLMLTGQQIKADAITGGANAQAAGTIGAANAWANGINGVANQATGYLTARDLMTPRPQPQTVPVSSGVNYDIVPPNYRIGGR